MAERRPGAGRSDRRAVNWREHCLGTYRRARNSKLQWSPEQIAGWLKVRIRVTRRCQVSHETIYKSLYIQARGALKRELLQHL